MTELSYQAIRTANQAREADELKTETRKKNILILVLNYLNEEGYLDSAQALGRETNIDVTKFEVCDNIDLDTIVMEYESYYYVKFAKYPKICKKLTQSGDRRTKMNRTNSATPGSRNSASQKNTTPSLPRIPQNGRPQSPPPQGSGRPKSGGVNRQRSVQSSTRRPNEGGSKSSPSIANGVANGDAAGLALQGLTVHGSNSGSGNTDNKPAESPSERMPRNKDMLSDFSSGLEKYKTLGSARSVPISNSDVKPMVSKTFKAKPCWSAAGPPKGEFPVTQLKEEKSFIKDGKIIKIEIQHLQRIQELANDEDKHPGQIIDIRAMLNDATRLNVEDGSNEFTGPGLAHSNSYNQNNSEKLLKPLGGYVGYNSEWRDLAQTISRDIYSNNPNVRWTDIIGLDEAKRLAKEAVVYPIKYPQLFKGILCPWKGLLLYGPPGTGKTLLAKAIATECNTTFFNISASSIVSKWRGDSEKLVRVLFEMARFHAPSTIFLDELEAIMSQRGGGGGGEHEGSRRMKTELLVQMDGLAKSDDLVFLLAASNLPWELDHAMLRRLEKRILVDLPTFEARKAMYKHHLPRVVNPSEGGLELLAELDYDLLALKTEGYSGADIKLVCKEAAMRPVRKIFDALENHSEGKDLHIRLDTIITSDVLKAIERCKPSGRAMKDKYAAWQREYESV